MFLTKKPIALILFMLLALAVNSFADIINVPDGYEAIGDAMAASNDFDTVLVAPGEYVENLNYNGKRICVGSYFIFYPDCTQFIEETIIDGGANDVVVAMYNVNENEIEGTELRGFTIQNGYQGWGGGVEVRNGAKPILADLIVKDNHVETGGGGLYFSGAAVGAEPFVYRCKIFENTAGEWGAGVGVAHASRPYMEDCEIYDNVAEHENFSTRGGGLFIGHVESYGTYVNLLIRNNQADEGGGIFLESSFDLFFYNLTVVNNTANEVAGAVYNDYSGGYQGEAEFINCIFWGNGEEPFFIGCNARDTNIVVIDYSCVEGGEEAFVFEEERDYIHLYYGDGNIESNPRFLDPDENDFTLDPNSPCVDAGDPNWALDPDSTRADMGYFFYDQVKARRLIGYVRSDETGEPIEDVLIETSEGQSTYSDTSGYFVVRELLGDTISVTASAEYFETMTLDSVVVDIEDDTTEVEFWMKSGVFSVDPTLVEEMTVMGDDTVSSVLTLRNSGSAGLIWSAEFRLPAVSAPEIWGELEHVYTDELLQDTGVRGVALVDGLYYLTGADRQDNHGGGQVYVVDRAGNLVRQFDQPLPEDNYGIYDLVWDGDQFWGIVDDTLFSFIEDSSAAGITSANALEDRSMLLLAWDPVRELFWTAGLSGEIASMDTEGANVEILTETDLRHTGLAYWENDPDGYPLYLFGQEMGDSSWAVVQKFDVETGDVMDVANLGVGDAFGISIIERLDDRSIGFVSVREMDDDENGREVAIHHIQDDMFWLSADVMSGEIDIDGSTDMTLQLMARPIISLEPEVWEGRILFSNSTPNGLVEVSVKLDVIHGVNEDVGELLPTEFGISATYPNPFNSTLRIEYNLTNRSDVSLSLYSIDGRLVEQILDDNGDVGQHTQVYSAETLPSGVYLLKLNAGGQQSVRKIALVR